MQKAPKVGDRVRLVDGHRYAPCTGTVTKVWPKRICLNDDELIEDSDAVPRYGGPAPEAQWQVSFKCDVVPDAWAYRNRDGTPNTDAFCPEVTDVEPVNQ